jgi:allantoicase
MTIDEATALAEQEIEDAKPMYKQVNNERLEFSQSDYDQAVIDLANNKMFEANEKWSQDRAEHYPSMVEFMEAYTEKEILEDSTKWDEYVVNYNQVRTDYPKPS